MRHKPKLNTSQNILLLSDEFAIWFAASIIGYSLLVPLLAIESLVAAESLMQFGPLHQVAMLVLIIMKSLSLFGHAIVQGWKTCYLLPAFAVGLLLFAVQPAVQCCTSLVAAIAGMLPWSEVSPFDAVIHMMPIVGSGLIMFEPALGHGKLAQWSLPTQSPQ